MKLVIAAVAVMRWKDRENAVPRVLRSAGSHREVGLKGRKWIRIMDIVKLKNDIHTLQPYVVPTTLSVFPPCSVASDLREEI